MTQITIHDLTIRQAKKLGRELEVRGFSKLDTAGLIEAIKMKEPDAEKLQAYVDKILAPEAAANGHARRKAAPKKEEAEDEEEGKYGDPKSMSKTQLEDARLEALTDIAKCAGKRNRIEEKLRSTREQLNQMVGEAKANLKGAMERDVDYNDTASVTSKLSALAEAWQIHEDAIEQRRQELEPLKEQLSKAKQAERKAFDDSRQLKLKF